MCTSNGPLDDWFGIPNPQKVAQQQAAQAQAAEAQRQAQIQKVIDAINGVYNQPDVGTQIDQIAADQYANWQDQIARARASAEQRLKAAMARSGMIGSSAWEQKLAGLQAGDQQALAEAQAQKDALIRRTNAALDASRNALIQQAQNGLSLTEAQQQADRGLAQALANANANAQTLNWNQFFNNSAGVITNAAQAQGQKAAAGAYVPVTPATAASNPYGQHGGNPLTGGY